MKHNALQRLKTFSLFFAFAASASATAAPQAIPKPPAIAAKAYILIDYNSGQIVAQNEAETQLKPASLTKMLTSYVIGRQLKAGKISNDDLVTISEKAWAKNFPDSSKMFIEVGKQVSIGELNRGIIIQSGNDACVAMAEHLAGSEAAFAELMNSWAKELGMNSSHFVNSHGLDNDEHYTTAHDMARLGMALIRDVPDEYAIYHEKSFTFNNITQYNRNTLLWDKSLDVDGIKTGHTSGAGYSLVSSATQDNMRLVAAVLGTANEHARSTESKKILNWGFRFFETVTPYKAGESFVEQRIWMGDVDQVSLGSAQDIAITIPRGQAENLQASFELNKALKAPLTKGEAVGTIYFQIDGNEIAQFPLVTLHEVEEGSLFKKLMDYIKQLFGSWFS
jgi:D-alanyl-D-alanine carboxypeptidase (penicillin-binding protein 5/6)